jgi:hypothetical protein
MRHDYKGFWGCDSCCDIEVQRRNDGKCLQFWHRSYWTNPGTFFDGKDYLCAYNLQWPTNGPKTYVNCAP